jgi:surfactin synthase thioesterase subunit
MGITPEHKADTTLFHTIDKQFCLDTIVNFQFHPENASEANNLISSLIPFLKKMAIAFTS